MKNKFIVTLFSLSVLASSMAVAETPPESSDKRKEMFAAHKAQIIANLNKEKSIVDASISCVNAAQNKEGIEKCHEQRKSSMESLRKDIAEQRQQNMNERKAHLQERSDKLNEKMKKLDEKATATTAK